MTDWAKARDSFNRLVQAAFGTGRARFCIPVEETDDDVTVDAALMAGEQAEARLAVVEAELVLRDELIDVLVRELGGGDVDG